MPMSKSGIRRSPRPLVTESATPSATATTSDSSDDDIKKSPRLDLPKNYSGMPNSKINLQKIDPEFLIGFDNNNDNLNENNDISDDVNSNTDNNNNNNKKKRTKPLKPRMKKSPKNAIGIEADFGMPASKSGDW